MRVSGNPFWELVDYYCLQVGHPFIKFESAEEKSEETAVRRGVDEKNTVCREVVEDEETTSCQKDTLETLEDATVGHVTNKEEAIPEKTSSGIRESSKFKNQCYFNNDLDQRLLNFAVLQPAIKS